MRVSGAAAVALGVTAACKPGSGDSGKERELSEGMPLRTNPNTGDKVSILAMAVCVGL